MPTPTIPRDELEQRLDQVVPVEAMPEMYFRKEHLPGAVNIPPDQVDELADERLPDRDAEIVVYCWDTACPYAAEVADRLVELGYEHVSEYHAGKLDWIDAGLPTERPVRTRRPAPQVEEPAQRAEPEEPTEHELDDWRVDVASMESFPASDAPGWR